MLHPHRARLIGRDVTQRYALLKPPHHRCHRTSHTSRGRRSVTGAVVVRLATAEGGRVRTHRHRNHHGQCVACGAASRPCSVDGASHGGRTVRVVHVALDGACLQCTHRASRLRGSEAGDTHRLRAARWVTCGRVGCWLDCEATGLPGGTQSTFGACGAYERAPYARGMGQRQPRRVNGRLCRSNRSCKTVPGGGRRIYLLPRLVVK